MSVQSNLKKAGIEIIKPLDTLEVNVIAKNVATKICDAFPCCRLDYNNIFSKLSRLSMYRAHIREGYAEANYSYKNKAIYFKENVDIHTSINSAIHECIHYLQEVRDDGDNLIKLGLCDFTEFKVYGMALNEAAVQYMTAKCLNEPSDIVKYYGIRFSTISPNFYPLICNLISQMAYLVGEEALFRGTLFGTDEFNVAFANATNIKVLRNVASYFDTIFYNEENLIKYTNIIQNSDLEAKDRQKTTNAITECKNNIQKAYMDAQNLIFTSFFDSKLDDIYTLEELEDYRFNLYNYQSLIRIYTELFWFR